jgi:tRNA pseudouridine32 synthase / 23S rRNA pseudouridine746 synthase
VTALPLLWRGAGLLAVDKAPGALVVPGRRKEGAPSLRKQLEESLGQPVWVVHRLDRETSGVLLFALDAASHRAASLAFERGLVRKTYLALVAPPLEKPLLVEAALAPARRNRMRLARDGEAGKAARTRLTPLESYAQAGLVEAEPLTGRTHQIRLHLQVAGSPLLVDSQYGRPGAVTKVFLGGTGPGVVLSRTPLHAARLVFEGGDGLPALDIKAPLPADMQEALALLRRQGATVKGAD